MIEDYNEAVREAQIDLLPCAYLHNYKRAEKPAVTVCREGRA
jgi:hypothetical protein